MADEHERAADRPRSRPHSMGTCLAVPGRTWGVHAIQDLIPVALGTNLWPLRFVVVVEARGESRNRQVVGSLRFFLRGALLRPPLYRPRVAIAIFCSSPPDPRARLRMPPRHRPVAARLPGDCPGSMNIKKEGAAMPLRDQLQGSPTDMRSTRSSRTAHRQPPGDPAVTARLDDEQRRGVAEAALIEHANVVEVRLARLRGSGRARASETTVQQADLSAEAEAGEDADVPVDDE